MGAEGHRLVAAADARVMADGLSYEAATPVLTEANEGIAAMLKTETDDVLGKVLFETSMQMKNRYARSDS